MIINVLSPNPLCLDNDVAGAGILNFSHTESIRSIQRPADCHRPFAYISAITILQPRRLYYYDYPYSSPFSNASNTAAARSRLRSHHAAPTGQSLARPCVKTRGACRVLRQFTLSELWKKKG